MPANSPQALRSDSPAGSEEGFNRKDKNYRRYASNVERALSVFDSALQEWADYIAFLGKLLKALQTRPTATTDIPHNALVAKRLAQCLDPMLPSGVHQKTLDVYAYVFSVLGKDSLSRDLSLYLPGLSSTLSFASLSVKPALLSLYETFIIPLNPRILRSALKAIVLALLPGLEEETSEEFERTFALLNRFRGTVGQGLEKNGGDQYFWQSLFLSTITSSSRRHGALAYLTRELPQLGGPLNPSGKRTSPIKLTPEVEAVTSPEPGLLIRCFAAGLNDEQLLVQRGFLDLLVTHLPLHSAVLHQKVSAGDLQLLVAAAASVVARREMSLNRRLWTWFLGPQAPTETDDNGPHSPFSPNPSSTMDSTNSSDSMAQTAYFEEFGLKSLVRSLVDIIADDSLPSLEKARPFRICLSLMDRWEIGGLVVPRIFFPAMQSLWRYQGLAPSKEVFAEVLRSASVFFDGIESGLIWGELYRIMIEAHYEEQSKKPIECLQPDDADTGDCLESVRALNIEDRLDLVLFIVTKFNVREEEMLALHIPLAILALLIIQSRGINSGTLKAFKIASHLLDLIPQRVLDLKRAKTGVLPGEKQETLDRIQSFYASLRSGTEEILPPMHDGETGQALLHVTSGIVIQWLQFPLPVEHLEKGLSFLDKLIRKVPDLKIEDHEGLMSALLQASAKLAVSEGHRVPFSTVAALVFALEMMSNATRLEAWDSDHRVRQMLPAILTCLWAYTSPSWPRHNVEAVRCLWRIHRISPDEQLVEGSIATLLFQEKGKAHQNVRIEGARRFATVWAHSNSTPTNDPRSGVRRPMRTSDGYNTNNSESLLLARPLMLLLDALSDPKSELLTFVLSWLQSLSGMQRILEYLVLRLHETLYSARQAFAVDTPRNAQECLYYLQTIINLVRYSTANIWTSLAGQINSAALEKDFAGTMTSADDENPHVTNQVYLTHVCMQIMKVSRQELDSNNSSSTLRQSSVQLLQQIISGPSAATILEMKVDEPLLETLSWSVEQSDLMLQVPLMDLILAVFRKQSTRKEGSLNAGRRNASRETIRSASQISLSTDKSDKEYVYSEQWAPPQGLLDCLILGISSPNSHSILEHWIHFLDDCLPFYAANTFQTIMPLVDCFRRSIDSVFQGLRASFEGPLATEPGTSEPITILNALLNGLEQVLARGHDRLVQDEGHTTTLRSPEQIQGFFGNMVSGVFAPEAQKPRSTPANNRLTVLLCFKDAVRVSFSMWSWGDVGLASSPRDAASSASFNYTSLRLRNRTRRILEHLFAVEALECLETLVEFWYKANSAGGMGQSSTVFNLLHALEGSRPKNTIPALFNAIYSRTNPNVLEPVRKSTLTSELSDVSLATFLTAYTRSMEDDALDEIWTDCMTFLKDVLGNPMPHRQTLPLLLEFTAILGEKIDNTNFGEQRKMRRDIGELFFRLLAATFTVKPLAFPQDLLASANGEQSTHESGIPHTSRKANDPDNVIAIVASILPNISKILVDSDRIAAATITISTQILLATFRWKTFPRNVTASTLEVLKTMSRIPEATKTWRKDVAEAFNDPRFFNADSIELMQSGWMPVLRQWAIVDKDRLPELLSRLSSPTSAGIMFGVGASSARLEADRKTQLNLRRTAFLMLSADIDTFIVNLGGLQEKLVDLMTATATSSPSSTTRAEVYMVLRALVLKNTAVHLTSFWPIVNTELYNALSSLMSIDRHDTYSVPCVLQAAKLLDVLLTISPDDFQMREWLFITDTIDAVYRPPNWKPVALADGLAESLDTQAGTPHSATVPLGDAQSQHTQQGRKPLLTGSTVKNVPEEKLVDRVLRPFLRQLSINSFESTYRMEAADQKSCCDDLLKDMFDDDTLV